VPPNECLLARNTPKTLKLVFARLKILKLLSRYGQTKIARQSLAAVLRGNPKKAKLKERHPRDVADKADPHRAERALRKAPVMDPPPRHVGCVFCTLP